MMETEVLRKIFDEKIISVLEVLFDNEEAPLSEISKNANVNLATTLRILNKLVKNDIIEIVKIGKSKYYKPKHNEKAKFLRQIMEKEDFLSKIIENLITISSIKKIVLESRDKNQVKMIIVTNFSESSKITNIISKSNKNIIYIEMTEKQFNDLLRVSEGLKNKIIWERK